MSGPVSVVTRRERVTSSPRRNHSDKGRAGPPPRALRSIDDLDIAVVEHIDWFDHSRLHGETGLIPPVEHEDDHHRQTTAATTVTASRDSFHWTPHETTVGQGPYRAGGSRHGDPVRVRHRVPSITDGGQTTGPPLRSPIRQTRLQRRTRRSVMS